MMLGILSGRLSWLFISTCCIVPLVLSTPVDPACDTNDGAAHELASSKAGLTRTLGKRDRHAAQDYKNASWIWTSPTTYGPFPETRPFRYIYTSNPGSRAQFAVCQVTADDSYSLFINGVPIGSTSPIPGWENWRTAQLWFADLATDDNVNVFALSVYTNVNNSTVSGLLMACRIVYEDGTIDTLLTDSSWRTRPDYSPDGFELPGFIEDQSWEYAVNEGLYGTLPWGYEASPSFDAQHLPHGLNLTSAKWISAGPLGNESRELVGAVWGFKHGFTALSGKVLKYATVIMSTSPDDHYYLYIDGEDVAGRLNADGTAQRYVVNLENRRDPDPSVSADTVTFAVEHVDTDGSGDSGVDLAAEVTFGDGTTVSIYSDSSWKTTSKPPANFTKPSFNATGWPNAVEVPKPDWSVVVPPI